MTIKVFKERTLIVPGFGGTTLDEGEHTLDERIEKCFVDAGFAEIVEPETEVETASESETEVVKVQKTPENKMQEPGENKESPKISGRRARNSGGRGK